MAANGEEGLKLVQEIKPDLILSDVMMPIMDGLVHILTYTSLSPFRS